MEKDLQEETSQAKNLKELAEIEEKINANADNKNKGEQDKNAGNKDGEGKPEEDGKPKEDGEPEDKDKKTIITDELRKKLNIPEKFKYMEDVVVWGSESEKLITKAANERQQVIKEKEQAETERDVYKQEVEKLKKEIEKVNKQEPTISKEEKQKMIDEFNELFVDDPIKAITKVVQKINEIKKETDKPQEPKKEDKPKQDDEETEKLKKEFQEKANKEWEDISKDLTDEQKKELLTELNKLSKEKPYILSLYDLKDLYDIRKQKQELKLKQEEERKKKARTSQGSPESTAEIIKKDKIKTINNAKDLKALDEAEKLI